MVSANPTGPIRSPLGGTAPTATPWHGSSSFAGHEVEGEYYYNDAGAQMERFRESVEARTAREKKPEDGYHGAYLERAGCASKGDPVPRDAPAHRGDTMADSVSTVDTWQKAERDRGAEIPRGDRRGPRHVRGGGRYRARTSAHGDEQDRVAHPLGGARRRAEHLAADAAYLADKLDRASSGPLRPRRRPSRHAPPVKGGRLDAGGRSGAHRGADLPARPPDPGGEAREVSKRRGDVVRSRRVPRRGRRRRRALVPRLRGRIR